MNTHEYYVSLETAKMLKEAGFDWNTFYCYRNGIENVEMCHVDFNWNMNKKDYEKEGSDNIFHGFITSDAKGLVVDDFISAPTLDVAQRWLREIMKIEVFVEPFIGFYKYVVQELKDDGLYSDGREKSYEEAQEAGIKEALELILEKGE